MKQQKTKKIKYRPFKQIQPTKWLGLDSLIENARVIRDIAKSYLLKSPKLTNGKDNAPIKSFDEAMKECGQTEEGLKKCIVDCKKIIAFCSAFTIAILCYSIYLLVKSQILAGIITFLLALNISAHVLRESFTIHQIRQRSVNTSFKDWFKNLFNKDP